jgi:hypothetical protein
MQSGGTAAVLQSSDARRRDAAILTFYEFFAGGGMARAGLGNNWRCLFANHSDSCESPSTVWRKCKSGVYISYKSSSGIRLITRDSVIADRQACLAKGPQFDPPAEGKRGRGQLPGFNPLEARKRKAEARAALADKQRPKQPP